MSKWNDIPSCNNCRWDGKEINPCGGCTWESEWERKPVTNADRIRSMTDEELAETIMKQCAERACPLTDCFKCWIDWLKQEAKT